LFWNENHDQIKNPLTKNFLKLLSKIMDPFRTILWVRRHDVVIVPGAGVLEATLPVRAYAYPLLQCVACVSGKAFGVKVALVSVGANEIKKRATRSVSNMAARTAFYRSYRDTHSIDAMRKRGINTSRDRVFPDLAFGIPVPPPDSGDARLVGVGLMEYNGGNDDRAQASEIQAAYIEKMTFFVNWLLDNEYSVRLFGGDVTVDYAIAKQVHADIYSRRPDLAPTRIEVETFSSYSELLGKMNQVGVVVATRFHNVLGALKLCKPTIAIGYSKKFLSLMDSMGLSEFYQSADSFSVDQLIRQFNDLQDRRADLSEAMRKYNAANNDGVAEQFSLLSTLLF